MAVIVVDLSIHKLGGVGWGGVGVGVVIVYSARMHHYNARYAVPVLHSVRYFNYELMDLGNILLLVLIISILVVKNLAL